MSNMDPKTIQAVKKVAEFARNSEKFVVAGLAVRLSRYAELFPNDAALVTAANILKKKKETFITRAELTNLYNDLYVKNTKLAGILEKELDLQELPGSTYAKRAGEYQAKFDGSKFADPILTNALEGLFAGDKNVKLYSKASADKAEKMVMDVLSLNGVTPNKVDVFAGQSDLMIVEAEYMTPKGSAHVLVPVEIEDNKTLIPSFIVTQAGLAQLSKESVEGHIKAVAGRSFSVNGEQLLKTLASLKTGEVEVVDEVSLAYARMKAASPIVSPNAILGQTVYEPISDVPVMEMEKTAEHLSIAERMNSPRGEAEFILGKHVVQAGGDILARKFAGFGYKNASIKVAKSDEKSITYACSVDRGAAFLVPMSVKANLVMAPTIAVAGGQVEEFSHEGIHNLISSGYVDKKAAAYASPSYGLKASDLMNLVESGLAEGNHLKAQDAIDVLAQTAPHMYKEAMRLYLDALNEAPEGIKKAASVTKTGCCKVITSSTSIKPFCGHLHVPVDQVYQDEHGECQKLYRKHIQAEQNPGGTFLVHKIFENS